MITFFYAEYKGDAMHLCIQKSIFLCLILSIVIEADDTINKRIGMLIWQNEAAQRTDLLAFWNSSEPFPSFGIGHFIWYPAHQPIIHTQQFPTLCDYLQKNGILLPQWLIDALPKGAPWKSREAFLADFMRVQELRTILKGTVALQTSFIIESLETAWPSILKAIPQAKKKQVQSIYTLMKSFPLGTYTLIDYCNFKGTGLNPKERAGKKGWGLLHVLMHMPPHLTTANVTQAFVISAAQLLLNRIYHNGPDYTLLSFFNGWMKRLNSYTDTHLFS